MSALRLSTFDGLRHREFQLLWAGLVTSGTGAGMQALGLGWLVILLAERDGNPHLAPFYIGLVGLARGLPALGVGLFGGVMADRFDRRKLLMITRLGGAAIALAFAALTITGLIGIQWVLFLTLLSSIDQSFDTPTRQALVPRLVPASDMISATGLTMATHNLSQIVGPLIGGLLMIPFGIGGLMLASALGYLAAFVTIVLMRPLAKRPPRRHPSVVTSIREGVSYAFTEPVIRLVIVLSLLVAFFVRPLGQLLPAVAHDVLRVGALELSWLMAVAGAGGLVGSMLGASIGGLRSQGLVLAWCVATWGAAVAAFSLQTSLAIALVLIALPSLSQLLFASVAYSQIQLRSPDELRARTLSVFTFTNGAGGVAALGQLALGTAGTVVGIGPTLTVAGCVVAAVGVYSLLRVRAVRRATAPGAAELTPAAPPQ